MQEYLRSSKLFIVIELDESWMRKAIYIACEAANLNEVPVGAVIVGGDFANDKDATNNCVLVDLKTNSPKFLLYGDAPGIPVASFGYV